MTNPIKCLSDEQREDLRISLETALTKLNTELEYARSDRRRHAIANAILDHQMVYRTLTGEYYYYD